MRPIYKPPPEKVTVIRGASVQRTIGVWPVGGKRFIRPVPLNWAMAAARLPGKASIVGQAIWFIAGLRGTEFALSIPSRVVREFGISRRAFYSGLKELAKANLISVVRRPGTKARITLLLGSAEGGGSPLAPLKTWKLQATGQHAAKDDRARMI